MIKLDAELCLTECCQRHGEFLHLSRGIISVSLALELGWPKTGWAVLRAGVLEPGSVGPNSASLQLSELPQSPPTGLGLISC